MDRLRTTGAALCMSAALMFLCTALLMPARAMAQRTDATFDSAVFLLRQAMRVSPDGRHNVMLRSLRHMAQPSMQPIFDELSRSDYPIFKIHGMLGLAECQGAEPGQIDLVRLATVEDPAVQAELVSAAMDSDLLTLDQCQQLVDWPGLDVAVKVIVSAPLVQAGRLSKTEPLIAATKAENLGRRSLANLLLMQLGHPSAAEALEKLNTSDSPQRDQVRDMLLRTAVRYELDRAGPWALRMTAEPGIRPQLGLMALSVAMRFNTPGSMNVWQQQYASTTDAAQRTRLALLALRVCPWASVELYQPLVKDADPLMSRIGQAGAAVASGKDITPHVVALVEMHHPIANAWALSYAGKDAAIEDARLILLSLVLAYDQGPLRGREQRLDDAISAVQLLAERSPDDAVKLIRPILASDDTRRELAQGILLGLIRAKSPRSHEVIAGLPPFEDINTRNLALLLLARQEQPLSPAQMTDLALCVRGGGLSQEALRIQAAWIWLKRNDLLSQALDQTLKP